MNPAARQILRLDDSGHQQNSLETLEAQHARLTDWADCIRRRIRSGMEWREEVSLIGDEGRQVLMCRGSPLSSVDGEVQGHVVVFDDITTLIRAQRDAAWGEVARRLAHEIKNPLTPIQLAAERMRHRLLKTLPEQDARVVDRSTHTIVQQVEALKSMVNDFSDYARSPRPELEPFELDRLVAEVTELYRGGRASVQTRLDSAHALIKGDPKRLRQVLHNLLKNASEAVEEQEDPRILIQSRRLDDLECPAVELRVADNGGGVDPALLERLFEPYVTSKTKGTGLGLAIVKKIIEEHGGIITAENHDEGAVFTARLPLWHDASASAAATAADSPATPEQTAG